METVGTVTTIALAIGAAFLAATLVREIPSMKRYLRIRRM